MTGSVRTAIVAVGAGVAFAMSAAPADAQTATAGQLHHQRVPRARPQRRATTSSSRFTTTPAPTTPWRRRRAPATASRRRTARRAAASRTARSSRTAATTCASTASATRSRAYPAGNGTTATGDATYTTDIPDNAGIALFNNNTGGGSYSLANRLDAVGSTSEANTLYKEGTGYPGADAVLDRLLVLPRRVRQERLDHRRWASAPIGTPMDTDNNATNFIFVDTNGTSAGAGQRLGAPGPGEPVVADPAQRQLRRRAARRQRRRRARPPNRVRDFTSDPANNSTFGTLDAPPDGSSTTPAATSPGCASGSSIITTFPAPVRLRRYAAADVDRRRRRGHQRRRDLRGHRRARDASLHGDRPGHDARDAAVAAERRGFNGSLSAGTVTLGTPLANGASINLQFLIGLQQTGNFKLYLNVEALP